MTTEKVRVLVAGSNSASRKKTRLAARSAMDVGPSSSRARGVGSYVLPTRVNSSSPKCRRSLPSDALIAGWLRPSRAAALVTLCSSRIASRARSRLRSTLWVMVLSVVGGGRTRTSVDRDAPILSPPAQARVKVNGATADLSSTARMPGIAMSRFPPATHGRDALWSPARRPSASGDSGERRPRGCHTGPSEQPHPHASRGRRRRSRLPHAEPPAGPFRHRLRRVGHPLRRGDREHPPRRDPARDSFRLLVESSASDRVLRDGHEHQGIDLRFVGVSHRIDFQAFVGASCWLYPQTEVFVDLHGARTRDGSDLRY